MEIKIKEKSFHSLKGIWQRLYAANASASPYASYEFASLLRRAYAYELYFGGVPRFFVFYKGEETIMIAPLVRRLGRKGFEYSGFGIRFGIVSEDFIYADSMSEDDMEACLHLLFGKTGRIQFKYLSDSILLYKTLKNRFSFPEKGNQINVMLKLPSTYDEYIASLSKNMRSNIRNGYNRLRNEDCDYRYEVFRGADVPKDVYKQFLRLYFISYRRKNSGQSWWRRALFPIRVKYLHPHAMAINGVESSLFAVLFINGKVAAATGGYLQKNNKYLLIPRITYDGQFRRCSPGIICLLETIKYLISNGVPLFDLSIGDESYKFPLGGETYWQYGFDARD